MKKFICTVLACGILTSAAAVYADEPMVIAPAPTSSSYSVVIENNTLDLGGETVYELNKHMISRFSIWKSICSQKSYPAVIFLSHHISKILSSTNFVMCLLNDVICTASHHDNNL